MQNTLYGHFSTNISSSSGKIQLSVSQAVKPFCEDARVQMELCSHDRWTGLWKLTPKKESFAVFVIQPHTYPDASPCI